MFALKSEVGMLLTPPPARSDEWPHSKIWSNLSALIPMPSSLTYALILFVIHTLK